MVDLPIEGHSVKFVFFKFCNSFFKNYYKYLKHNELFFLQHTDSKRGSFVFFRSCIIIFFKHSWGDGTYKLFSQLTAQQS